MSCDESSAAPDAYNATSTADATPPRQPEVQRSRPLFAMFCVARRLARATPVGSVDISRWSAGCSRARRHAKLDASCDVSLSASLNAPTVMTPVTASSRTAAVA
eukprot:gnl/TRDRNA2_/TRDRNA2_176725_c1_seq5.p3 gnl/TRDRNA2_/TRDRNA2_176725_c1~~gnl/TRDRNA2_/TRDRNA2_176725_c1_seq5.p3  ORF type:complete len:104 (+),score=13.41 gnl/TRDRNA2_/TRDRNA2_176725_c1_seq5:182-493(+)